VIEVIQQQGVASICLNTHNGPRQLQHIVESRIRLLQLAVVPEAHALVCTCRWRGESSESTVPLQLACRINTEVPGTYRLRYTVTNSAGLTAMVSRRVIVVVDCQAGERRCDNEVCEEAWCSCMQRPA
jgi:hypothetical protein